jgi:hypothetical protein
MNASSPAAAVLASAFFANALLAVTFTPTSPDLFAPEPLQVVGAGPAFSAPANRAPAAPARPQAVAAPRGLQTGGAPARPGVAANPRAGDPSGAARAAVANPPPQGSPHADLRYVFYCFGPVFGNDGREVDPNYMPQPTVAYQPTQRPTFTPVQYTRVSEGPADVTTWVGADGSRISYQPRNPGPRDRDGSVQRARETATQGDNRPSVAEIIAENRRELTRISWERAYRRYPDLERSDSPERVAFDAYLAERRAEARDSGLFENPLWPERVSSEFMTSWNWRKTEEESWERVRTRVRVFNDVENPYTRRFLEFTSGLRANPQDALIFRQPTWPERALELHDERLGPVPDEAQ